MSFVQKVNRSVRYLLSLRYLGIITLGVLCHRSWDVVRGNEYRWKVPVPRILIATTTWWPLSARLAMALAKVGCDVAAICPTGNPLLKLRNLQKRYAYHAVTPLRSLRAAIVDAEPQLIVPCDDRAVGHLHQLYAQTADSGEPGATVRRLIERSLGAPDGYPCVDSRDKLMQLARTEGIRIPKTRLVSGQADLDAWRGDHAFPWVLKADGTWGGTGVRIAETWEEAQRAYQQLAQPITLPSLLIRLFVNHDPFPLLPWLMREQAAVSVQDYVSGRPANMMLACWQGEVLASISVEVLSVLSKTGSSTVVRIIDNPEMTQAGLRIVRRLQLSGFCGFDFIIEEQSGSAHLIEMNARSTQLGHLQLGAGRDLPEAMRARLLGVPPREWPAVTTNDTIAFFPQAWLIGPISPYLQSAYHDVPWIEPELVRELVRQPWTRRSALARLFECYTRRSLRSDDILPRLVKPSLEGVRRAP
jgi:ATP-grasp domain